MAAPKRVLCRELPRIGKEIPLSPAESNHLISVLRLQNGDQVEAMDGKGQSVLATLRIRSKEAFLAYIQGQEAKRANQGSGNQAEVLPIHLELAILKGDAFEWVIEKAVEMGVSRLTPLETAHTVVQISKKGPEAFRDRWQKIADQALKQCGRLTAMQIDLPVRLENHVTASGKENRLIAMEDQRNEARFLLDQLGSWTASEMGPGKEVRILIGPEGGWSASERALLPAHGTLISLGPVVFRAETAALFSASLAAGWLRCS
ncbi:MAG: 16S rRNA (uracil(1498)-N(3))-methyltransferase [Bdellovibrionales bacterium]|nr:16S rRNA (uracil(1498)-N(3))-methyltransferase [Bdellovibrionales bacterium]